MKTYVLDASVIIEILGGSDLVKALAFSMIARKVKAYATRLSLTEASYATCRLWGEEISKTRMKMLLDSKIVDIVEDNEVWGYAAECKCKIPIDLGDCFTLGASKKYNTIPFFLRSERELTKNEKAIEEWLGRNAEYVTMELSQDNPFDKSAS